MPLTYKPKPKEETDTKKRDRVELPSSEWSSIYTDAYIKKALAEGEMARARLELEQQLVDHARDHGAETHYKTGDLSLNVVKPRPPGKDKRQAVEECGMDYFPVQSAIVRIIWEAIPEERQAAIEPLLPLIDMAAGGSEAALELLGKIGPRVEKLQEDQEETGGVVHVDEKRCLDGGVTARSYLQSIAELDNDSKEYFLSAVGANCTITMPKETKARLTREAVRNTEGVI